MIRYQNFDNDQDDFESDKNKEISDFFIKSYMVISFATLLYICVQYNKYANLEY